MADADSLQKQALPVEPIDEDFDPSKPPENAQQYLQFVMYERALKCPDIVRVPDTVVPSKRPDQRGPEIFTSDPTLPPSEQAYTKEWQRMQITSFSQLRDKLIAARKGPPPAEDGVVVPKIDEMDEWLAFCASNPPLLKIAAAIRYKDLGTLLEYLLLWLQAATSAELAGGGDKQWITLWIYSVLANLPLPLHPDVCATLRDIAKCCKRLRQEATVANLVTDEENLSYNLLICIIAVYFRQYDLNDSN